MTPVKAGWKTTEFWLTLIGTVLGVLVALGVISAQDMQTLEGAATSAVTGLGTVAGGVLLIWQYIRGRTAVKEKALAVEAEKLRQE